MTERETTTKRLLIAGLGVALDMLKEAEDDADVIVANEFVFNLTHERKRIAMMDALDRMK